MLRKDLSTLSVKRIIFLYNKKVDFKKKFIALTKQTAKIERELTNLDELVDFLDGISEIYYGMPIGYEGNLKETDMHFWSIIGGQDYYRSSLSQKASNKYILIFATISFSPNKNRKENCYNFTGTKQDAIIAAKDFVSYGLMPDAKDQRSQKK